MRKVIFNTVAEETAPLYETDLVDLVRYVEVGGDLSIEMPLRLIADTGRHSRHAVYLDDSLGTWELVRDQDGALVLVCVEN